MNAILIPVLLPLAAAILSLLVRHSLRAQAWISGVSCVILPFVAFWLLGWTRENGPQSLRVGAWPQAFGIVMTLDMLGALMIFFASLAALATWGFIIAGAPKEHQSPHLIPLFLFMNAGVHWAFVTGDLFNLFVSFEVILLSSYALLAQDNTAAQLREGSKFVVLNVIASTLFLATAGLTYGIFGVLNMADLAVKIAQLGYPPESVVLGTMFLLVFCIKAAAFPLFFWLPDAYPVAPPGGAAYFGGVLTKVGIYCLLRVFTLIFRDATAWAEWFQPLLLAIGGATMFIGVMGAYAQKSMRRILAFHIVSQIGYMIFAVAIFTPLAIAFGIFFVVHNMIVKSSLLLVADSVVANEGSDELRKVPGLLAVYPGLAALFLLAGLSLAGVPPLSGFFGKFGLIYAGIAEGHYLVTAIAVVTGLFTLASMVKIWRLAFWGERPAGAASTIKNRPIIRAASGLVIASLVLAMASGWFFAVMRDAANESLNREPYIESVLGIPGVEALRAAQERIR